MNLFEECQNALGKDCHIVDEQEQALILEQLYQYLAPYNIVDWHKLTIQKYINIGDLVRSNHFTNDSEVYIVADSDNVPIFKSKLQSVLESFEDVVSLSSKVFIFNYTFIIQEEFPSSSIKVGYLPN